MSDRWDTDENKQADEPQAPIDLRKDHPELYGALLGLNERIDRSGGRIGWFMAALWVLCVVAIIGEWTPRIFGASIRNLQSFWVYALMAFLFFVTNLQLQGRRKTKIYREGRDEIEREMARAHLTTNRLIAAMHGDGTIELVAAEIKGDDAFDVRRR